VQRLNMDYRGCRRVALACVMVAQALSAEASLLYWDTNGFFSGATSGTTAPGTWGSDMFWSTSGGGYVAPTAINTSTDDDLYFSAGTNATGVYTVTLNGTQSAHSVAFEEGSVTISGGTKLVLGGTAPTITTHADATIASVIDGTAGLSKAGSSRLILAGNNTYTGTTVINEGTLQIGNSTATGTVSGAITNNSTLAFFCSQDVTYSGTISGSGLLVKCGAETLMFNGSTGHSYAAETYVYDGELLLDYGNMAAPKDLLPGDGSQSLYNATLRIKGKNGAVATSQSLKFAVNAGDSSLVVQSNGGTANVTLTSLSRRAGAMLDVVLPASGSIVTSQSNTYGVLGGWATVGGDDWATNSAGTGTGALAAYSGYITLSGSSPTIPNTSTANVKIDNSSSGNTAAGSAMINSLLINDSASRTVTIGAGNTLNLGRGGGILIPAGAGAMTFGVLGSAGTLTAGGAPGTDGEVIIINNSANAATIHAAISDNGSGAVTLTKNGPGTLSLTGNNTYTGDTLVSNGRLELGAVAAISGSAIHVDGALGSPAALRVNGGFVTDSGGLTIGDIGSGTLSVESGGHVFSSVGSVGHSSGSTGRVTVTGAGSSWTNSGEVSIGGSSLAAGGAGSLTVADGGQVSVAGRLRLWKADSLVTVAGGSLSVGQLEGTTGAVMISDPAGGVALTVGSSSADATFTGTIADETTAGTVRKIGAGTWTLGSANNYSGGTMVGGGTLKLDFSATAAPPGNIINPASNLVLSGGALVVAGSLLTTHSQQFSGLTLGANSANTLATTSSTTVNLILGPITRNRGSTLALTLPNWGGIATTSGAANSPLVDGGGVLYATVGTSDWAAKDSGNTKIVAGSSIDGFYTTNTATSLAGNADMARVKTSLTDDTSIASLRFNRAACTIVISSGKTLTTGGILVGTAGSGTITGGALRSVSSGGGDLVVYQNNSSETMTIASTICDNAVATGLTKAGSGTLILTGDNTYTGTTLVHGGTLRVGNNTTTGSVSNAIANHGTLAFFRSNDLTYSGTIGGSGSLCKYGAGALTLNGPIAHAYNGSTMLYGGGLLLDFANMPTATNLLVGGGAIYLYGTTLRIKGKSGAFTTSQSLTLVSSASDSDLIVDSNAGTATNITLTGLSRVAGSTLDIVLSADGGISTSQPNTNGILGGWATVSGANWATNSAGTGAGSLVAYSDYTTLSGSSPAIPNTSTANVRIDNSSSGSTAAGSATINSLAINDSASRTVAIGAGNTLNLRGGGILIPAGAGAVTVGAVGSPGTLTARDMSGVSGEVIVINNSANAATINAAIADNGSGKVSLTKSGPGTLSLTGSNTYTGSTYLNDGRLELGAGAAIGGGALYVDGASFSPATLRVNSGSVTGGDLYVGNNASGAMTVQNSGRVSKSAGYVGYSPGSTGSVTVDGAGSQWNSYSYLYVGRSGSGTVTVRSGGLVSSSRDAYVGYLSDSTGSVTVDGAGARWDSSSSLYVGYSGSGTLTVSRGAQVSNTKGGYVGYASGSTGSVTVDGAGSQWNNLSDLYIGYIGFLSGTLRVQNGGLVSTTNSAFIGYYSGSSGSVTVDGVSSKWNCSSSLYVGWYGSGTLAVSGGGLVSSATGYIGDESGSMGSVTVTGAGSKWINNGDGHIGGSSSSAGTLTVSDGGQVRIGGKLKLWGANAEVTVAGGTLSAGTLEGTNGCIFISDPAGGVALTVGSYQPGTFSGSIRDGTAVGSVLKIGTSTWTLSGVNTYSGSTMVSGGTLELDCSVTGAPSSNIIDPTSGLVLAGAALKVRGDIWSTKSQEFSGLTLAANSASTLRATSFYSGAVRLTLGPIARNPGSTLTLTLPEKGGIATTSGAAGSLLMDGKGVAYATVDDSDWAAKDSGNSEIVAGSSIDGFYTTNTATSLAGNADMGTGVDTFLAEDTSISSLRFNSGARRVAVSSGKTLTTGSILVSSAGGGSTITGGTLRSASASGGELVVFQNSSSETMTIGSTITDNAMATGLTKAGGGMLILTGNNTYTGTTVINAGGLQVGNNTTTGSVSNAITNNGTLVFFRSDDLTYSGAISGSGLLYKYGVGTLSFNGATAHAYTGSTTLYGGGLLLDFSNMANPTDLLSGGREINLYDARLNIKGKSGALTTNQSLSLSLNAGDSEFTVDSNGGMATNIALTSLRRLTGSTLDIVLPTSGSITTSYWNTNGILGGWATVRGADWATKIAGSLAPYTGYTTLSGPNPAIADISSANVKIDNSSSGSTAAGSATINSLVVGDSASRTVTIGMTNTLNLGWGGGILIPIGAGEVTLGAVSSAGTLTAGGMPGNRGELIIINHSANTATINAAIADNGSGVVTLTKSGPGTVSLTGNNTYTGDTFVNNGQLEIGVTAAISATNSVYVEGTSRSPATMRVDGGSATDRGELYVGYNASGTLMIQNGGRFSNTGTGYVGYSTRSTGSVTVDGTGSRWASSGFLHVGALGSGILTIQNGGQVSNTAGCVGGSSGSTGSVMVTGDGSTWTNSGDLYLGGTNYSPGGTGSLTVADGGQVSVAGKLKLWKADSRISIDGGSLSAGTLEGTTGSVFVSDPLDGVALTLGSSANATFSGSIADHTTPGSVEKVGSGTLTLAGTNTYTGNTIVSGGTLQVTGSIANNDSGNVLVAKDGNGVFGDGVGDAAIVRRVTAAGTYAGLGSSITGLDTAELATTADIRDGAAGEQADVSMSWRSRTATEKTRAGGGLISEVVSLTGIAPSGGADHQTDVFVLQMRYDPGQLLHIWGLTELQAAAEDRLYLGCLDLGTDGLFGTTDDGWTRAVDGNIGGTPHYVGEQAYEPSYFALGDYGVDTANHEVWAVLNHNSQFAVGQSGAVPEPSTITLLGAGAIGLLVAAWSRRKPIGR